MSGRILRWFGDQRNDRILTMIRDHLTLTQKAVEDLYEMVVEVSHDPSRKKKFYDSISDKEMRADQLRRDMVTELSIRNVFPDERDDLMEIVRAVDWIADWSREAGRILNIIPFEKTPDDLKIIVQNMCRENVAAVKVLGQCIKELSGDPHKALELANQVELLEEDLDDLYGEARSHFVLIDDGVFTRGALILLNEFLDSIETVSDWCENTADIARAIAVRVI